jgi:hypothetical protein
VTLADIDKHGSYPTYAPVNPYTLFAEIFNADYLPSNTAFTNGSVAFANSYLAYLLALSSYSNIIGSNPFLNSFLTK